MVRVVHVDVPALGAPDSSTARLCRHDLRPPRVFTSPAGDTLLPARVRITEADRRLISGDLGYVTDAGLSTEARWTHRNFSGGGRSLT
jgi:hypothetical protein